MYDESIQRALRRHRIEPVVLPAQFLDQLLDNLRSDSPRSEILTGTAGDGKTYHCREAWIRLGGSETTWNTGDKIQRLQLGPRELVVVKDLSELRADESAALLADMVRDVTRPAPDRIYLIAANHGQLLEKLKAAPQTAGLQAMVRAVEELLVTGENPDPEVRLNLRDLSQAPASQMIRTIIAAMTGHPGWDQCEACPIRAAQTCPIWENRARVQGEADSGLLQRRLMALVELSEQNGIHFPVRQLLALVANTLLGHPDAPDGLMSCADVPDILACGSLDQASVYRNIFGENLKPRRAEKSDLFRKLNAFGIGGETSNRVDNLLVYGADDPALEAPYRDLVLNDPVYGGTVAYTRAQHSYLEGSDASAREEFLPRLRAQRQRMFFVLPEQRESEFDLWDLTVFRYGGLYLDVAACLTNGTALPRRVMPMIMRGLNRVFTGMLVQNQDELVLATSGSHSQSKTSPLLDELISVPRQGGEEAVLAPSARGGIALSVRLSRGGDPGPIGLALTPTRFEFLGRVAEGALPSSFSLECHEDLLAFKAKLLSATERRRVLDEDERYAAGELVLRFIELGSDGRASPRRVTVRT
ncbi:hypothetical protein V3H18_03805 [Methylocystis sp. 9N]|uniref:Uncharacterized protein n=1 Tax=Methylocystis borbori TaxID=3118750 RepID=A0ABU7XE35_9HYPH